MEWWHVYLFTRIEALRVFAVVLFVLLMVVGGGTALVLLALANESLFETTRKYKKAANRFFACLLISCLGTLAIPSQKEAAAIYLLPKLANSDFMGEVQQIPADLAKLLRLYLQDWLNDVVAGPNGEGSE